MAKMGRYCKAYPVERFQAFAEWDNSVRLAPKSSGQGDENGAGNDAEAAKSEILYLQENYTVTRGIFIDEEIVFDNVTPEWVSFCQDALNFEVPSYEHAGAGTGGAREESEATR